MWWPCSHLLDPQLCFCFCFVFVAAIFVAGGDAKNWFFCYAGLLLFFVCICLVLFCRVFVFVFFLDSVQGLVFVASLIDYNKVLYENDAVNGMQEALKLFSEITIKPTFKSCEIILILNKKDLLEKLLQRTPNNGLAECFNEKNWEPLEEYPNPESEYWDINDETEYRNNPNDPQAFESFYQQVITFILNLFTRRNNKNGEKTSKKRIYHHITIATSDTIVASVFNDIQSILVNNNLKKAGLIKIG